MSKYYISNNIQFVQGYGNLQNSFSSATHFRYCDAERIISQHPDYVIMRKSNTKKNNNYIVSTQQKFVGNSGEIVLDINNAKVFESSEDAFKYLNVNKDIKKYFDEVCVIDDKYNRIKISVPSIKPIKPINPVKPIKPIEPTELNNNRVTQTQNLQIQNHQIPDTQETQKLNVSVTSDKPQNKLSHSDSDRPVRRRVRINPAVRKKIMNRSNICSICGKPINADEFSIDHITPVSHGGTNSIDNLRPVHRKCNIIRNNLTDDEFLDTIANISCYNMSISPDFRDRFVRDLVRNMIYSNN